jgi:hypothetical protein
MLKKDRQPNCYRLAYPKKMLPTFYQAHLQKQLTHGQFMLLTILLDIIQSEKQVRLERLARVFPYPITTESLARQITKISRFAPINDLVNLVPFERLFVNHLLLSWANFINSYRSQSMGVYQSVNNRLELAQKIHPLKKSVCYPN